MTKQTKAALDRALERCRKIFHLSDSPLSDPFRCNEVAMVVAIVLEELGLIPDEEGFGK